MFCQPIFKEKKGYRLYQSIFQKHHLVCCPPKNEDLTMKDFHVYFNLLPSWVDKMQKERSINFGKSFNCTMESSWNEEDCSETFLCFVETIRSLSCEMDGLGEIQFKMQRFFTQNEIISGKRSVLMESYVWVLLYETLDFYPQLNMRMKADEQVFMFLATLMNGIVPPPPSLQLLAYNAAAKEKKNADVLDMVRHKIMLCIAKGLVCVKDHRQVVTLETLMKMDHMQEKEMYFLIDPCDHRTSAIFSLFWYSMCRIYHAL